jgi:SAM-dependent methyltransferase
MVKDKYDADYWDHLWSSTIEQHPDKVASRRPNSHLAEVATDLTPGRALDAGCGHGVEARWLAARGWHVIAADFSLPALEYGEATARTDGDAIADRIEWVQADLGSWTPPLGKFDLVVSFYVHVADQVTHMIERLAGGVVPGGLLLLVGHRPIDPETGTKTRASEQNQVSVEDAKDALASSEWELLVVEERPRAPGQGVDAVILARRRA